MLGNCLALWTICWAEGKKLCYPPITLLVNLSICSVDSSTTRSLTFIVTSAAATAVIRSVTTTCIGHHGHTTSCVFWWALQYHNGLTIEELRHRPTPYIVAKDICSSTSTFPHGHYKQVYVYRCCSTCIQGGSGLPKTKESLPRPEHIRQL